MLTPVTLLWIGNRKEKTRAWLHKKDNSSSDRLGEQGKKDGDKSFPHYNGIFGTKVCLGEKFSFSLTSVKRELYKTEWC